MSIKNQVKSFTANVTKKEMTNFFVFLGGISGGSNLVDETDISYVSRITKDEVSTVVPRVNWSYGTNFEPYYLTSTSSSTYCYNDVTDIVYLCVGKNQPTGLLGETAFPSTESPTHENGVQTYTDGYSWLAMYRIDFELSKFLTESFMPVSNINDYTTSIENGSTLLSKYNSLCPGGADDQGSCYFYYVTKTKEPVTDAGYEIYENGDQITKGIPTVDWECWACHEVGEKLGYKSAFYSNNGNSTVNRNSVDELESSILSDKLDVNDRFYIQYKNYEYVQNLNNGIQSLQLDVSSLSIEDRICSVASPEVIVLDALGFEATANIETYYDIRRNVFIANGITLKTPGQNYINPSFKVTQGTTNLENAIKAVVLPDIIDPSTFLPNPRISVVKTVSSSDLTETQTEQTIFSKIGIVKNIKTLENLNPTDDTTLNKSIKARTTTKITLSPVSGSLPSSLENEKEIYVNNKDSTTVTIKSSTDSTRNSLDYGSKLTAYKENYTSGGSAINAILEIAGVDELAQEVLQPKSKMSINSVEYTITNVNTPNYKLDNVNYVTTRSLPTNIKFEKTGSIASTKLSFLI
jgi:hypothetical protein